MKKFLTMMTLFVAMALTACGGAANNEEEASQEQPASSESAKPSSSSKHTHTAASNAPYKYDDNNHWQECEANDGGKVGSKAHTWVEDTDLSNTDVAATCEHTGLAHEKCSVCGKTRERVIAKTEHNFVRDETKDAAATCEHPGYEYSECSVCHAPYKHAVSAQLAHDWQKVKDNDAVSGFVTTSQYKCELTGEAHYALRWSALEYDEQLSNDVEKNTSGSHSGSVRLNTAENKDGTKAKGSHLVYKVKVGAAVEHACLAFDVTTKSGYDVPVFDYVSGDAQQGYIEKEDGTLELTTKRYGLIVNGQNVELGEDGYGNVNGKAGIFDWVVDFPLTAGDNVIDVYCLGGYRAYINAFMLTGLPENA